MSAPEVASTTANPVVPAPEAGGHATVPIDEHNSNSTSPEHAFQSSPSESKAETNAASENLNSTSESVEKSEHSAADSKQDAAPQPHDKAQLSGNAVDVSVEKHQAPSEEPIIQENTDSAVDKSGGEGEEVEDKVYPGGLQLGLLTFGLCIATFTVALDNTVLATAIPKITTVFPNSLKDVGWYGSSYLLTTTALQPSFGRIYTYFDVKTTYLFALCLFELGSIICAASKSSVMLIVGRAVAGAGASALFSGAMTIVGYSVPLNRRPIYMASISSMFGISSVVGPLLGGAFTDRVSWRWCFWINLPFGAIALATVYVFFKSPKRKSSGLTTKEKVLAIDLLGAFVLICAIVCLLLALQWGGTTYPWKNSKVWGCLLGFGLLIIIFIAQQFRRGERATIPPRIIGQRTVLSACLYSCFLSMGLYVHIYFLPFYFQAIKGTTAEQSGIRTIPYLASIILSAFFVGAGITALGPYKPFMIFGGAIFTIGAGMIYLLKVSSTASKWIGYQLLSGFGAGAGVQVPFIAVQVVLSEKDMATGSALAIFFNSLGGAISISIAQNVFSNGLSTKIPKYAPDIPVDVVVNAGATHLREAVNKINPAELAGVIKGYMMALNEAYVISIAVGGIATIAACFVEWKSVKGKKIQAGGAA